MRQAKLSKNSLHRILSFYEPGVKIEMDGTGYTTYWKFVGKSKSEIPRVVEGRLVSVSGFCTESICLSRREIFSNERGMINYNRRVDARDKQLKRWLHDFQVTQSSSAASI